MHQTRARRLPAVAVEPGLWTGRQKYEALLAALAQAVADNLAEDAGLGRRPHPGGAGGGTVRLQWYQFEGQWFADGPHPRLTGPAALTRFDGDFAIARLGPAQTVLFRFRDGANYGTPRDGGDWEQVFEVLAAGDGAVEACKRYAEGLR